MNVGTYEVTAKFTANDNYNTTVDKTATLTINPVAITGKTVTLSATDLVYSGKELQPTVSVAGLTSGDYDVAYTNNVETGTATVTITGKGNYIGKLTATFTISSCLQISL